MKAYLDGMRVGIFGGTHFVGRHIVRSLLNYRYADITLMNRCNSNMHLYPHLNRICLDRSKRTDSHGAPKFDCIIDTTSIPFHLINTIMNEGITTDHYIYISTASVYEWNERKKFLESNTINGSDKKSNLPIAIDDYHDYVHRKYSCEKLIKSTFEEDKYLIIRPGYVCGKHDNTNRFDYSRWPDVYWKGTDFKLQHYDDVYDLSDWISEDLIPSKITGILDTECSKKIKIDMEAKGWKI